MWLCALVESGTDVRERGLTGTQSTQNCSSSPNGVLLLSRRARKYLNQSQTGGSDVIRFENVGGLSKGEQSGECRGSPDARD